MYFLKCILCDTPNVTYAMQECMGKNRIYGKNVNPPHLFFDNSNTAAVCRLSPCTLLRRLKFSAMFLRHLVRWPSVDIQVKFYGDRHG